MRDRLASFCRRLGVKGWQDLNGRPRSSKSHGKSRLKGNFKVIRFSTLSLFSPSTIFPVNKSPVYAPVPLSTHPTLAGTPSGPNVWCASHICAPKKLGLYPAIGNGKLQKDSEPFRLVLFKDHDRRETWIKEESLNHGDQLGGLGQNLGLR